MSHLLEIVRYVRTLGINPLAAVIVAALLAAILEQRWLRKRAPVFSKDHLAVAAPPELRPRGARSGGKARSGA